MTTYDTELAVLPAQYIETVTRAGGLAVMIPPQPITLEQATSILEGLDGLIITGGADINPARYGQDKAPTPKTQRTSVTRSKTPSSPPPDN